MPHSEYQSGSSCICKAYQEVTDRYTTQRFGDNLTELRWGFGGIDLGCTSESVMDNSNAAGLGCFHEGGFDIADMKTLANERSQSRLWSGMHFSASVPTDEELCQGLGSLGLDLMNLLRNNSTLGDQHTAQASRPVCSTYFDAPTPGPTSESTVSPNGATNTETTTTTPAPTPMPSSGIGLRVVCSPWICSSTTTEFISKMTRSVVAFLWI